MGSFSGFDADCAREEMCARKLGRCRGRLKLRMYREGVAGWRAGGMSREGGEAEGERERERLSGRDCCSVDVSGGRHCGVAD